LLIAKDQDARIYHENDSRSKPWDSLQKLSFLDISRPQGFKKAGEKTFEKKDK